MVIAKSRMRITLVCCPNAECWRPLLEEERTHRQMTHVTHLSIEVLYELTQGGAHGGQFGFSHALIFTYSKAVARSVFCACVGFVDHGVYRKRTHRQASGQRERISLQDRFFPLLMAGVIIA